MKTIKEKLLALLNENGIDTEHIASRHVSHDVVGIEPESFSFAKAFKRLKEHMDDLEITPVAVIVAKDGGMNGLAVRDAVQLIEGQSLILVEASEFGVPPSVFML